MAEVAAIIGNYAGIDVLADCVASIRDQTHRVGEIVVVDGASPDRSVQLARELETRVIETENRGLGHLYNVGALNVEAPYVLLLNNDVALDPGCVEHLVAALEEHPSRFAADPTQLDWAGERVIHARTIARRGGVLRTPIPGLALDPLVPADAVAAIVHANGGAMLARRSMLLDLDGFDETFFMDFEDLDLGWRAWLRGWESVYVPDALVRHKVGAATQATSASAQRLASAHTNLIRFALKCLPPPAVARVLAGEILRLARHPRPVGVALARTARDLPRIVAQRRRLRPTRTLYDRLTNLQE
jgi:GT2 family glycosyltransferase